MRIPGRRTTVLALLLGTALAVPASASTLPASPSALTAVGDLRGNGAVTFVDGTMAAVDGAAGQARLTMTLRDAAGTFPVLAAHVGSVGTLLFTEGDSLHAIGYDVATGRSLGTGRAAMLGPVEDIDKLVGSLLSTACGAAAGRIPDRRARLAAEVACAIVGGDVNGSGPAPINPTQVYWYNSGPGTGAIEAQQGYPGLWTYLFDVSARPVDTTAVGPVDLAFDLRVHGRSTRIVRRCTVNCALISIDHYVSYYTQAGDTYAQVATVLQESPGFGYFKLGQAVRAWTF